MLSVRKAIVPALAVLLLVGAGCPSAKPAENTDTETPVLETAAPSESETTPTALTTTVAMDATWQTYTNKAVGVEFRWPTKGSYAPRWEVLYPKADDASVKDGCVTGGDLTEHVTVGGTEFCHTWTDGYADLKDWYVTKHGEQTVVIAFTKVTANAAKDFSKEAYREHLDQIVSTYKSVK